MLEAIFGFGILAVFIWILFIRGALFKLLVAIFAFYGLRTYLWSEIPSSHAVFLSAMGMHMSYATFFPLLLIVLAMATTGTRNE